MRTTFRPLCLAMLAVTACGCAGDRMIQAREAYSTGRYGEANQLVGELVEDGGGDQHLYQLEHGVTDLAVEDPDAAIGDWRGGRDQLGDPAGRGFGETFLAWIGDDNAFDYEGTAYERVLVRAMLALAEIAAPGREMGDDALAYAQQVIEQHIEIRDELRAEDPELDGHSIIPPDANFKLVSFGSYLVGAIREEDPVNFDEALAQYRQVVQLEPDREWIREELERLEQHGFTATPGHGVLRIIGLVGRAPYKVEKEVEGTDAAFALANIIVAIANRSLPQLSFSGVPIDVPAAHPDNPDSLAVFVDGEAQGQTRTVTNVEQVAAAESAAVRDYKIARAIIRRAFKFAAVEGARAAVRNSSDMNSDTAAWADLGILVLGAIWQESESADLRCWSLLPAHYQSARIELPPGEHDVQVVAQRNGRMTGMPQSLRVVVRPGRTTWVIANTPTERGGSPLLSRDAVREPQPAEGGTDQPETEASQ